MAILTQNIGKINPTDIVATLDTETGVMTISGAGETKNFTDNSTVNLFPNDYKSVRKIIVEEGITKLGNFLFSYQGMTDSRGEDLYLESITLPDSIETFDNRGNNSFFYTFVKDFISIGPNKNAYKNGGEGNLIFGLLLCKKLIIRKERPSDIDWMEKYNLILNSYSFTNTLVWNNSIINSTGEYVYHEEDGKIFFEGIIEDPLVILSHITDPSDTIYPKERVIPNNIDGKPVYGIDSFASVSFTNNQNGHNIIKIGSNVREIKNYALTFSLADIIYIDSPRGTIAGEPWNSISEIYYKGEKIPLSIEMTKPMTDRIFYHSQPTEARDIEITATYEDGSKAVVTNECTISRYSNTSILFTYKHLEIKYEIIYYREISLIIASPPDKTEYEIGEPFDSTGLRVDVRYEVSESGQQDYYKDKPTEDYTIDGFDSSKEGKCTVRIYAMELSTSFYVNIVQPKLVGIEITLPTKLVYTKGELFDDTGLVVKAIYSIGKKQEVTDYILSGYDENIEGIQTITVSWQTFSETFTVTVIANAFEKYLNTTDGMEIIINKGTTRESIFPVKGAEWFRYGARTAETIYVSCDGWIGFGRPIEHFGLYDVKAYRNRLNGAGISSIWRQEGTLESGKRFIKIRIEATTYAIAQSSEKPIYSYLYELFIVEGQTLYINLTKRPIGFWIDPLPPYISDGYKKELIKFPLSNQSEILIENAGICQKIIQKPYYNVEYIGMEITSLPQKTNYLQREKFVEDGLVISLIKKDGTKEETKDYSLIGFDSSTIGTKEITVIYRGLNQKFNINVLAANILKITKLPDKLQYNGTESLNTDGLIVTLIHENGTNEDVTGLCSFSNPDMEIPGEQAVIVSYNGLSVAFKIEVTKDYVIKNMGTPIETDVIGVYKKRNNEILISGKGEMKGIANGETLFQYFKIPYDAVVDLYVENGITKVGAINAEYHQVKKTYLGMSVEDGEIKLSNADEPMSFFRTRIKPNGLSLCLNAREQSVQYGTKVYTTNFNSEICVIHIPDGVTELRKVISTNVSMMDIPPSVTTITNNNVTSGKNFMEEIWLQNIETIPDNAFDFSIFVKKIYLSNKVKELGKYAFSGCLKLEELVLPKSVVNLYQNASETSLGNLPFLKKIYFLNPNLEKISLKKVEGLTIYGFLNSTAQTYANENAINFVDLGTFQSLELIKEPDKKKYKIGDLFDIKGINLQATYSSGETVSVPPDEIIGFDSSTEGTKTVTLLYESASVPLEVEIVSKTGIEITSIPIKTEYAQGEIFDEEGLCVSEIYSDGSKNRVHGFSLSGYDRNKFGEQNIVVSYDGDELSFPVKVSLEKTVAGIVIKKLPDKISFKPFELFSSSGIEVELVYGDGSKEKVLNTDLVFSGYDTTSPGSKKILVRYNNFTTFYNIEIIKPVEIRIEKRYGSTNAFFVGDKNDGSYPFKVKSIRAIYADGTENIVDEKDFTETEVDTSKAGTFYTTLTYLGLEIRNEYVVYGGIFTTYCGYPNLEDATLTFDVDAGVTNIDGKGKHGNIKVPFPHTSWGKRTKTLIFGEGITSINDYANNYLYIPNISYLKIPSTITTITKKELTTIPTSSTAILEINHKKDSIPGAPWGKNKITVIWSAKPVELIIKRNPSKTRYIVGEKFDPTGIEVEALYSNGLRYPVTNEITFSDLDFSKPGDKIITVSFTDDKTVTAFIKVTVASNTSEIKIMKYPNKMYYKIGEKLDTTGLIVVKVGDLGYIEEITDFSVSELDSTSVGEKEITISYSENINADTTAQFLTYFTVKVTKDGDNPFDGDATPYKVIIHWPNGEFADLTNSDLSEKVSLQESLCNENYFIFGGCNSNMLRFTTHSKQFLSTEEAATPHGNIELYLEANGIKIKMFTGTIDTGKRTSGLSKREIIAYDYLYKYRNTDISWWYKNITVDKNMMITQKQFRDLLFDYLGIEQVPTKLYYDDAMVPDNNTSGEINVVRILKDLCLQNGVFGWMNHDGKFEYVRLPENSRVKALDNSGNKIFEYFDANIHYDNYKTCSFTEGKIWYPNKVYTDPPVGVFTSGEPTAQEAYESNTFYNRNSFFVGNTEWLDAAFQGDEYGVYTVMEPIFPVCYGTFTRVTDNLYYRAQGYDLTVRGNPMNKVGDMIEIKAKKILDDGTELVWDIYSYIMSRTLNLLGDTSMEDVYSAKNAPYNGNNTQAGRKTQELSAELFQMRSEQPIISYAPFTSGSFSRAITSGEKKKDKLKCVKRISKADYDSLVTAGETRTDTLYFIWEE